MAAILDHIILVMRASQKLGEQTTTEYYAVHFITILFENKVATTHTSSYTYMRSFA